MTAPASPLRLRLQSSAPVSARDSLASEAWLRKEPARLSNMAGALFLMTLTALSGAVLYAFSRGPSATPLVHASTRLAWISRRPPPR